MAEQQVVVIGSQHSFLVTSIIRGLEKAGLKAAGIEPGANAMPLLMEGGICILFLGDQFNTAFYTGFAQAAKKKNLSVILIGETQEISVARTHIPGSNVTHVLSRPVDMELLLEDIQSLQSQAEAQEESGGRKRILVVDDDPTMLQTIRMWLQDKYTLFITSSGAQAITLLAKQEVDLVLLDYAMPVTDGPAVLGMMRSMEETKDIPVIFLTTKNDRESVMKAVELKADSFILKSLPSSQIIAKIDEFVASMED